MDWDSFCIGAGVVLALSFAHRCADQMGATLGRWLARREIKNAEHAGDPDADA